MLATKKPTPDLHRAPDPGEGRDRDLVWVLGPLVPKHPHQIPIRTLPGLSRGSGLYQDLVWAFGSVIVSELWTGLRICLIPGVHVVRVHQRVWGGPTDLKQIIIP